MTDFLLDAVTFFCVYYAGWASAADKPWYFGTIACVFAVIFSLIRDNRLRNNP